MMVRIFRLSISYNDFGVLEFVFVSVCVIVVGFFFVRNISRGGKKKKLIISVMMMVIVVSKFMFVLSWKLENVSMSKFVVRIMVVINNVVFMVWKV